MSLFGAKQQSGFLGVDIGASGIKLVELGSRKGRPILNTYAYTEQSAQERVESYLDNPKRTGELVLAMCKRAGCKTTAVMAALPVSSIFSAIVVVPGTADKKTLKEHVDAQVAKLTPMPIAEMITYSTVLESSLKEEPAAGGSPESLEQKKEAFLKQKQREHVRVLVTGAARTLVQKYVEIFREAKLQLQAIDTEAFALIRALVGKDRGTILLLDLGYERTSLTIVQAGVPYLTRSINLGGTYVTSKIAEQMKVPVPEAEQVKLDLAQAQGDVSKLVQTFLQPIVHEVKYAISLFGNMEFTQTASVEKVIVTGGSSQLPGVAEALSTALNMSVYRGDPWARITYPQDLRPVLDEIGPRMSVAVGLAMRDLF